MKYVTLQSAFFHYRNEETEFMDMGHGY